MSAFACADPASEGGPSAVRLPVVDSGGTELVSMADLVECRGCSLRRTVEVVVSTQEGRGAVESESPVVFFDPGSNRYAVSWQLGSPEVDVYDAEGSYLRSFGGTGEGPGELSGPPYSFVLEGDVMTVLDSNRRRRIRWGFDGELLDEVVLSFEPRQFIPFSGDSAVLVDEGVFFGRISDPFVLFDWTTQARIREFGDRGAVDPSSLRGPEYLTPLPGGEEFVATWYREEALEVWSVRGELVRVLSDWPEWFPELHGEREPDDPPASLLGDVRFDANGVMWVRSMVPAPTWREYRDAIRADPGAAARGSGSLEAGAAAQLPRRLAPRIDAFDLAAGTHLGSWTSEAMHVLTMAHGDEVWFYSVEFDDALLPSLVMFRLDSERE